MLVDTRGEGIDLSDIQDMESVETLCKEVGCDK